MGSFLYFKYQARSLPSPIVFVSLCLSPFFHCLFFLSLSLSHSPPVRSFLDFATSAVLPTIHLFFGQLPERIGMRGRSGTDGSGQCLLSTPARDCGWRTMSLVWKRAVSHTHGDLELFLSAPSGLPYAFAVWQSFSFGVPKGTPLQTAGTRTETVRFHTGAWRIGVTAAT